MTHTRVSVNGKPQVSKTWTVGSIPITRANKSQYQCSIPIY